ncbi:MAG TPA: MYXO-CTERM sorting domain-containing protein [Polyangiaceae bacterium]|nr:MYXO-CTERM sorting domain-containing protein [Polyangiaceae bacterium]
MTLSSRVRQSLHLLALPVAVASLAACSSESHTPAVAGAREGIMKVYTATYDDGRNERQFFLKVGDEETRLVFAEEPDVNPGDSVEVWGKDQDDGLHVTGMRVEDGVGTTTEALIDATPYKARTFGFVFVDIGGGVNITKDDATKRLFGTNAGDNSVKQYYEEASYDTQDISGDVLGPLSYSMVGCSTSQLAAALKPMLPRTYDHYLWYLGSRNASCGWSGLAEEGTPTKPQNDTWYNASAGCVVLVQEPGHNFGMQHSSSMTCGSVSFVDTPQGTCTHNEYGDKYDPMGGGCNHMNAWQKVLEGWLQGCNITRIKSSGTFTLLPIEAQCDGAQVLQIPMPHVRPFTRSGGGGTATNEQLAYYYLELRTARGFDTTIRGTPTVLVHVGEDFRSRAQQLAGRHTWILDMDPSTKTTLEGLTEGKSFTDPLGGLMFTVTSLSADQAQISVTIPNGSGGPTCFDGTPVPDPPNLNCMGVATGNGGMGGAGGAGGVGGNGGTTATEPPRIEQFTLINADTGADIMPLTEASTVNLDVLPAHLTVRADTDPPTVGSVVLQVDGGTPHTEDTPPYVLTAENAPNNYMPWTLGPGSHTLTATPYSAADGMGTVGAPLTVTFTLSSASTLGAAGAPSVAGAAGAAGAMAFGAGGFVTSAGGTPAAIGGGGGGATGTVAALGGAGFAGYGGGYPALTDTGNDSTSSCGCRIADRDTADAKSLALVALAAGLGLRRRRRRDGDGAS